MTDKKLSQKNWSSWHHQLHKEILTKKILIPKGSNILISVSGGQDSMALLTLINDLKKIHKSILKKNDVVMNTYLVHR